MHPKFADWIRPVTFGYDTETIKLRWNGVESTIRELDFPGVMELVRLAFGRPPFSTKEVDKFRIYLKDADPRFLTEGNDFEVQTLAGSVLGILCTDNNDWFEVPLAILAASACKTRDPMVEFNLVDIAAERVRLDGIHDRKRPSTSEIEEASFKNDFNENISAFSSSPNFPTAAEALNKIGANIENLLIDHQSNINKELGFLRGVLTIQDEELQMLWWMVGGWSEMWKSTFRDLDSTARPILLAKEVGEMTEILSESPALKAVFSRVGIDGSEQLAIANAVNSCGAAHLKTLSPQSSPCSTIFPVHFGVFRANEVGADNSWISAWSKVSGIDEKAEVIPLELALQFHREIKLMKVLGASDE